MELMQFSMRLSEISNIEPICVSYLHNRDNCAVVSTICVCLFEFNMTVASLFDFISKAMALQDQLIGPPPLRVAYTCID